MDDEEWLEEVTREFVAEMPILRDRIGADTESPYLR